MGFKEGVPPVKAERHRAILSLVEEKSIETQAELAHELSELGFVVTQTTISRDIKELGLVKIPTVDGRYKYDLPREPVQLDVAKRIRRIFEESLVSIEANDDFIVIKALPGTAQGVAACIDGLGWDEIMGTIGGDDTVLVITRSRGAVVAERLRSFIREL
jgi:transcriptional regulator of arginine metabolism